MRHTNFAVSYHSSLDLSLLFAFRSCYTENKRQKANDENNLKPVEVTGSSDTDHRVMKFLYNLQSLLCVTASCSYGTYDTYIVYEHALS